MVWSTFFPRSNGQLLVLGGGYKKLLHDAGCTEGGGGLKLFGQCPYGNNTFQKRGFPRTILVLRIFLINM